MLPGITVRLAASCAPGQRLVRATHAVGFYSEASPTASMMRSVHVTQVVRNGVVHVSARGGAGEGARTLVQVDLTCAVGA